MNPNQTATNRPGTVTLTFTHGAAMDWDKQDDWQQNAKGYRCTLRYRGRRYTFDYWLGQGFSRTDGPTADLCLRDLLSDANAGDNDFHEFCSALGYDEDSRKAEATWRACQNINKNMRRLLGSDYDAFLMDDWD
jgi:hypothetical protein